MAMRSGGGLRTSPRSVVTRRTPVMAMTPITPRAADCSSSLMTEGETMALRLRILIDPDIDSRMGCGPRANPRFEEQKRSKIAPSIRNKDIRLLQARTDGDETVPRKVVAEIVQELRLVDLDSHRARTVPAWAVVIPSGRLCRVGSVPDG